MEIGKIPNDILKNIILDKIKENRSEVLIRPKIGEDCCGIDFEDNICVMSSDPITGTANEIGKLAVHISCNDIASCGSEPIGLLVTILAPPNATYNDLETVMKQLTGEAASLNVDIVGGHTEITSAVNRFVLACTCIGKVKKEKMVTSSGAKPKDKIIVTKTVGLEGTAIIAHEKENELERAFGREFVCKAKKYINNISVVKEGVLSGSFGVSAMHDVTEGGVLGALWEIAEASEVGVKVDNSLIPVGEETRQICEYYGINPLKLISSGCMLITCSRGEALVKLLGDNGIPAAIIGEVTEDKRKVLLDNGMEIDIAQPGSDELYKVV
ncbi:MAG TPA: AIR synthase [Clostridiaceae bacterium]|nr:AIR synthase [Clostridiaceae bacterium]